MNVNDFINSMVDAGFEFTFKATNGEMTLIGVAVKDEKGKVHLTKQKIRSSADSRALIKAMFKASTKEKANVIAAEVITADVIAYAKRKG